MMRVATSLHPSPRHWTKWIPALKRVGAARETVTGPRVLAPEGAL